MIDKISITIDTNGYQYFEEKIKYPIDVNGHRYVPKYQGDFIIYLECTNSDYDNKIRLYRDKLNFEGSLHKLYNRIIGYKGNHTDFTREQLVFVIEFLEELFNSDSSKMILRNIEVGVNLNMDFEPSEYFEMIGAFQTKKTIQNMLNGNKTYGKQTYLSQYKVKIYDKRYESKKHQNIMVNENILRYEIAYKKMAPLKGICKTLSDLKNEDVLSKLGQKLIKTIHQFSFEDDDLNASDLKLNDRTFYYAGINPKFWLDEKKANPNGCHNLKAKWKRLLKCLRDNTPNSLYNIRQELFEKVESKVNELI